MYILLNKATTSQRMKDFGDSKKRPPRSYVKHPLRDDICDRMAVISAGRSDQIDRRGAETSQRRRGISSRPVAENLRALTQT
uniref:Uncharacterized protein n=1 Tax=Steinernema glaseri TaxID=37863 RepID=A0A1I8AII7_9BILA